MITNTFDSRVLGFGDCYGQRFMKPGVYRYDVVPAGGGAILADHRYAVEVEAAEGETTMKQHDVVVRPDGAWTDRRPPHRQDPPGRPRPLDRRRSDHVRIRGLRSEGLLRQRGPHERVWVQPRVRHAR